MSTLKRFWVRHEENEVLLEVDTSILTPELATEINNFQSGSQARLADQGGDVVQTVVRMFGAASLFHMQRDGWACFDEADQEGVERWTMRVLELEMEGWPDYEGLGIRIVQACVATADYYDVSLEAA